VGIVGAYASLAATEMAIQKVSGASSYVSSGCIQFLGCIGFLASASLRGFATKKFAEDAFLGLKASISHVRREGFSCPTPGDIAAGLLTLLSAAGQAQIVFETHIQNPVANDIVVGGNIIGTASTSFWGYKNILSLIPGLRSDDKKRALIRKLDTFKEKIKGLSEQQVDLLFNCLENETTRLTLCKVSIFPTKYGSYNEK